MVEICEHDIDPQMQVCRKCYLTAEEIAQGRDQPPSWYDVDYAYQEGRRLGIEIGRLLYKQERRTKLIEVGYYLCLRRLGQNIKKEEQVSEVAEPENGEEQEQTEETTESKENGEGEESEATE